MPYATKKSCRIHGCPGFAMDNSVYCPTHRQNDSKSAWLHLYKTAGWKRLRQIQLRKEPLCRMCKKSATDVDHIVKHNGNIALFFNDDNLQSLCASCHSRKSMKETMGY